MSKIGELLSGTSQDLFRTPSFTDNNLQSPVNVDITTDSKIYDGGTVTVNVSGSDTQESVARCALLAHAKAAGLSDTAAVDFANKWVEANRQQDGTVSLYRFTVEGLKPYSDAEFNQIKASGKWADTLNPVLHHRITADLNDRLWNDQNPAPAIEDSEVITIDASEHSTVIKTKDGALNQDQALHAFVQQTLNKNGAIYVDKVDQVVDIAKNQGVSAEVGETSADGKTAKVFLSDENKQKLERIFAEAVNETQHGVRAGEEGQREATLTFTDVGRVYWNAAVKFGEGIANLPSDIGNVMLSAPSTSDGGFAKAKIGGLPEIDAQLPQSETKPLGTTPRERLAQTVQDDPNSMSAMIAGKDGFFRRFDFSNALAKYQSEQFNKDVTGAINPEGVTMGTVVDTGVSIVAPIAVSGALNATRGATPANVSVKSNEKAITSARQVSTGGLRNEVPLTEAQKAQALEYAKSLGIAEENVVFSDNMNTSYKLLFGQDRLYIGTDVLPATAKSGLSANSRVSMRGAIAHELEGHRTAELLGKTHSSELLEEVQASIRAARFAPDLTTTERVTLIRDALERLQKAGLKIREVKGQLWVESK